MGKRKNPDQFEFNFARPLRRPAKPFNIHALQRSFGKIQEIAAPIHAIQRLVPRYTPKVADPLDLRRFVFNLAT